MASVSPQPRDRSLLMLSMLVLAVFCTMAARSLFSPLMPTLQRELGFGLSAVGSLFLLVSISYGVAMLLSGFLSARIGHGMAIVTGLGSISIGLVTAAVAANVWVLAAGMVLIGGGAGTYPPSGLVMINTLIAPERRNTAISIHELGPNLALLLAPLIVIALEPWFGWRGVLLWSAALCVLAALAVGRWGVSGSGHGAAPKLGTISEILRLRTAILGMVILSAALSGVQGVYSILPAYLVSEHGLSSGYVNTLLSLSRVAGILLLVRAGAIITRIGRRPTIIGVLIFSAVLTGLIGLVHGPILAIVVVAQPALLTVLFPAVLSSIGMIGDIRHQNVTFALILTIAVAIGVGGAPTLLGILGDLGVGWVGFVVIALYMLIAAVFLRSTPAFGRGGAIPQTPSDR